MRFSPLCLLCSLLGVFVASDSLEGAFTEVAAEAGFTHPQTLDPTEFDEQDLIYYFRGGAAVGDYDGDGWDDVLLTRHFLPAILYRNEGDGTFRDATAEAGLPTSFLYHSMGAAFADLDNDGDADLVVTTVRHNRFYLYLNEGDGTFKEEAIIRGTDLTSATLHNGCTVAVGDYDRDGWLDLAFSDWTVPVDEDSVHLHSALLRNRGVTAPGYFENVTRAAGVLQSSGSLSGEAFQFSTTPAFVDADLDHWPDLLVTADFYHSRLFWNNGDGRFLDGTHAAGVGTDDSGIGGDHGDVDGDGRPEWFITALASNFSPGAAGTRLGNRLFKNIGHRSYLDYTNTSATRNGGWAWGAQMFDFDNDGDLDLAQVTGVGREPDRMGEPEARARTVLWANDGGGVFTDVAETSGLVEATHGGGLVAFDYDRDGDVDVLVSSTLEPPLLYRNDAEAGNFIRLRPVGYFSNRDGFNTKIWVQAEADGPVQYRDHNPTGLYLSNTENWAHFGLGDHTGPIHSIRLQWSSGLELTLHDVSPNQELIVDEPLPIGLAPPLIEHAPTAQAAFRGQRVVLAVTASGVPEVEYQWFRDGQRLPGETRRELVFEEAQPADAGAYHVRLYNLAGAVETTPVPLTIHLGDDGHSVARRWNEAVLDAIRRDYPAPTVHSRNLFHLSAAMWDAWAAYGATAAGVFVREKLSATDVAAARAEAISYAAYRILSQRYQHSPGHAFAQSLFDALMDDLGYERSVTTTAGSSAAALGNRIAATILLYGIYDGANEENDYVDDTGYTPVNEPFNVNASGTVMTDPNRWQPISLDFAVTQNGLPLGANTQEFLGSNWGKVKPFALTKEATEILYHDPGPPPLLGTESTADFQNDALEVVAFSTLLDPTLPERGGERIDIGPATALNNPLGTNDGNGYNAIGGNPVTGEPYALNLVKHADYGRVLAEFWADGPASETPPGHWNTLANDMTDHPLFKRAMKGIGPELDPLEWDVKMYLALNGAVSDAAIAAWGIKAHYDYVRPISMIRYMAGLGQSSEPTLPSYHEHGLPLVTGLSELITEASSGPGERHAHLSDHVGEMALFTWLGEPDDPRSQIGGVGWMRALDWSTYQLSTFVSPPFAAYVSGHSTFSRAAAEVLTAMTGTPYFPGGLGSYHFETDWLEFEAGPTEPFSLQWATYYDAADQAGLSRLYGGIHVRSDDLQGRLLGALVGNHAWAKALTYFDGSASGASWGLRYEDWAAVRLRGLEDDPDAVLSDDGLTNRELYAFGLNPESTDRSSYPEFQYKPAPPAAFELTFGRPAAVEDLRYLIETSEDFETWSELSLEALSTSQQYLQPGYETHTILIPTDGPTPQLYRLRVTEP